jgi:uncharacterized membrane protein
LRLKIVKKQLAFYQEKNYQKFITLLFILVLVIGVVFRFINIDRKSAWDDEAFTALRISGYTEYELVENVANTGIIDGKELAKYQNISPDKTAIDTIKSLALEEPQHTPLYYILSRFWVQLFGNSTAALRTVAAIISLLALPSMYWLCWELFASHLIALIAVAFISVSPFHVLYAQEAREYSLWTATILFSSASLLCALRLNRKLFWGIYTLFVTLSLYTFPSSILVTFAQGTYVAIIHKFRLQEKLINYIIASALALTFYLPWLSVVLTGLKHINQTVGGQGNMNSISLIKTWAFNLSRLFIDSNNEKMVINFGLENSLTFFIQLVLVGLIVTLTAYSLYYLCQKAPKKAWLFILILISVTSLPIMLKDLLESGTRSIILRYLTPGYLGIQISIAYLLASNIRFKSPNQNLANIIICLLLSGSIISCTVSSQAYSWWNKSHSDVNFAAAKLINQSHRQLIISDGSMGTILGLSRELDTRVMFNLKPQCYTCISTPPAVLHKKLLPIPEGFDVFLFDPSLELIQEVKADSNYHINPVGLDLWRLEPSNQKVRT